MKPIFRKKMIVVSALLLTALILGAGFLSYGLYSTAGYLVTT